MCAEVRVLVVSAHVVGVVRRPDQTVVPALGHTLSLPAIRVGVVPLETEVISQGLLIRELDTLHPTLGVHRHREVVLHQRALRRGRGSVSQVAEGLTAEADVVLQVHVKERPCKQRSLREVPLQADVVVGRADRLQVRVATRAAADPGEGPGRSEVGGPGECRVIRARHGL